MSQSVNVAVVGYGSRLAGLIEKLPGIRETIRVRAILDPSEKAIARCRAFHGEDVVVCDSIGALVGQPGIDWVAIGSWNCQHREHAVAALEAGKHVFCEKPLATTLDDAVAIASAWHHSGRTFSMGFTLRYSPHYQKIKELITSGVIGDIVSLEFNETLEFNHGGYIMADWRRLRENAGTHLLEKCCHDIDLVNWLVASRAVRVASFGGLDFFVPENIHHQKRLKPSREGAVPYASWPCTTGLNPFTSDKDIIDNQVAIIEYACGVRATFHTNCNAAINERRMYIIGTEGAIRGDVITGALEWKRVGFDEPTHDVATGAMGGHGSADEHLVQSIAASMLRGEDPLTDARDGLLSAITCFGIDQALDTGTVVDLRPLWIYAGVNINSLGGGHS